jgi:hypothetical protein
MSGSQGTAKAQASAVSHSSSVPKRMLHFAVSSRSLLQIALSSPIAATASRGRNAGVYRRLGSLSRVFPNTALNPAKCYYVHGGLTLRLSGMIYHGESAEG